MKIPMSMQILAGVLVALGAYLIGNINTAILLSKMKGKDIRKCGSGNPGTMNMIRTFGKPLGALTLILDVIKGIVPCLLGWLFMGDGEFLLLGSDRIGMYIGGFAVEIGHIFPVFYKFKGGKGIATVFGVCLTCQPIAMAISFAVGLLFLITTKIGSMTSFMMLCSALTIEGAMTAGAPMGVVCSALVFAMFALTLFAHRQNLVKLFSGKEGRVVLVPPRNVKPSVGRSVVFDGVLIAE